MDAAARPVVDRGTTWALRDHVLSRAACLGAIDAMAAGAPRLGGVLRQGAEVTDVRLRSCMEHLAGRDVVTVVVEAFWSSALAIADRDELSRLRMDGPKFCSYPAGGYFRAHRDRSDDLRDPAEVRGRILSLSCVLNDGDAAGGLPTFDGGSLILYVPGSGGLPAVTLRPSAGAVVVFRSDLMHEVRAVRSGTRFAAVAWLYAPHEGN